MLSTSLAGVELLRARHHSISGAITSETPITLTRIEMPGPDVSLNGSPTVLPTTAALWARGTAGGCARVAVRAGTWSPSSSRTRHSRAALGPLAAAHRRPTLRRLTPRRRQSSRVVCPPTAAAGRGRGGGSTPSCRTISASSTSSAGSTSPRAVAVRCGSGRRCGIRRDEDDRVRTPTSFATNVPTTSAAPSRTRTSIAVHGRRRGGSSTSSSSAIGRA